MPCTTKRKTLSVVVLTFLASGTCKFFLYDICINKTYTFTSK
jgi:hypothetical protein